MTHDLRSGKCVLKACTSGKVAHWVPMLVMYAAPHTVPVKSLLGIAVCDDCRDIATVADFLSDVGFAQISSALETHGRKAPMRELTELDWLFIDPEDIKR